MMTRSSPRCWRKENGKKRKLSEAEKRKGLDRQLHQAQKEVAYSAVGHHTPEEVTREATLAHWPQLTPKNIDNEADMGTVPAKVQGVSRKRSKVATTVTKKAISGENAPIKSNKSKLL